MARLTQKEPSGKWTIRGVDLQAVPPEVYGALCKLLAYENTGLDPEDIDRMKEDMEDIAMMATANVIKNLKKQ